MEQEHTFDCRLNSYILSRQIQPTDKVHMTILIPKHFKKTDYIV